MEAQEPVEALAKRAWAELEREQSQLADILQEDLYLLGTVHP